MAIRWRLRPTLMRYPFETGYTGNRGHDLGEMGGGLTSLPHLSREKLAQQLEDKISAGK